MTDYFHKQGQTFCCAKTAECFALDKLYISYDVVSPMAMAHIVKHIAGKEVGCDALKWNELYPTPLMLTRFLTRCRQINTKVKMFNYSLARDDLQPILDAHADIIEYGQIEP